MSTVIKLSEARPGDHGVITEVAPAPEHGPFALEVEQRLLELGLVEGARVRLLHEGLVRRDPIAVQVEDMRVALRRREAAGLTLILLPEAAE